MDKNRKFVLIIATFIIVLLTGAIIYGLFFNKNNAQITAEKGIIQLLPYETDEFLIEHTGNTPGGTYTISLYAVLNGDSQLTQYNIDLKQYKNDALKWITDQGINYKKLNINWLPPEAAKL